MSSTGVKNSNEISGFLNISKRNDGDDENVLEKSNKLRVIMSICVAEGMREQKRRGNIPDKL